MTAKVHERVLELYQAFGDVPRPAFIPYCDHCRTAEEFAPLIVKPLREVSAAEFWQYAHSVFWTAGSEEDFLYFCPRLLDLAVDPSSVDLPDLEVVLKKLRLAGWEK